MSAALVLGLVGGLLVVDFLANRVFGLTRIPDVLVLMMLGVLLGPVMGLVQADTLAKTTNLLGTLAIILVLFEGGLELNLRDTVWRKRAPPPVSVELKVKSRGRGRPRHTHTCLN